MHHIIIGGGPAGLIAAETIRKLAPFDNISIISDWLNTLGELRKRLDELAARENRLGDQPGRGEGEDGAYDSPDHDLTDVRTEEERDSQDARSGRH